MRKFGFIGHVGRVFAVEMACAAGRTSGRMLGMAGAVTLLVVANKKVIFGVVDRIGDKLDDRDAKKKDLKVVSNDQD